MNPGHALRVLVFCLSALAAVSTRAQDLNLTMPGKLELSGKAPVGADAAVRFRVGVNYPWHHYGWDFGETAWGHQGVSAPESRAAIAADLAFLKSKGVASIRWFLLGDGRAAPEFDAQGRVTGFDAKFYADVDAALELAQQNGISVIFVLLDFHLFDPRSDVNGVQLGGRASLVNDPKLAETFFANALRPLLQRYGKHPAILAWDVINEPELRMKGGGWNPFTARTLKFDAMRDFVARTAAMVHAETSQYVTLGSYKRSNLEFWKGMGFDFYQYHYYEYMELWDPLDVRYDSLGLDKPCILGEFGTKGGRRGIESYLDTMLRNGFAGAYAWSLRAEDDKSDFRSVADRAAAWIKSH
ncbi:MAG TPA: hypothetical protein DD417_07400 [Elusimicrobia bacterium]|nr:hypothetical protein [Elusimicrobiota bacterium]